MIARSQRIITQVISAPQRLHVVIVTFLQSLEAHSAYPKNIS